MVLLKEKVFTVVFTLVELVVKVGISKEQVGLLLLASS